MTTIDAHKQRFLELLTKVFGQQKVASFPAPLMGLMEEFFGESFDAGRDNEDGVADQGYDNGFAEGFDAGAHQAYVELRGNEADQEKAQEFQRGLRDRHRDGWANIAKGEIGGQTEIYQDNNNAWRWVVRDRKRKAVSSSSQGFTTEYGARLDMIKRLGLKG